MTVPLVFLMLGSALAIATTGYAPKALRVPISVFNGVYILTVAIGATVITVPDIRYVWALMFPNMDEKWLAEGGTPGYWFIVWGPMIVTNAAALVFYLRLRAAAVVFAKLVNVRVDVLPATCAGLMMSLYCAANLAYRGYLSVSVFSSKSTGLYRENIRLRAEMFDVLGTLHFACIYMGIPAIAIVALYNYARFRSVSWLTLFVALSAILVFFYAATLTKSNVLIYGLTVTIAANVLGLIGSRGMLVAAICGIAILSVLMSLLSGSGILDFGLAGLDVIFREASGVPFYAGIFPEQVPFTGIDLGLGRFGIGPEVSANFVVANYMFPKDKWVQGAAAISAHISSYAQGGYAWSLITMVAVGAWIAFSAQLRRSAHGAVAFSAFMGSVTTCYYLTQADFVGAFDVAYGYKWWIGSLLALIGLQSIMRQAVRVPREGEPSAASPGAAS